MLLILVIVFKADEIYRSHSIIVAINLEALRQNEKCLALIPITGKIYLIRNLCRKKIKSNYVCDQYILRISLEYYNV